MLVKPPLFVVPRYKELHLRSTHAFRHQIKTCFPFPLRPNNAKTFGSRHVGMFPKWTSTRDRDRHLRLFKDSSCEVERESESS